MRFVSYNVSYGIGPDGVFDLDRIASAIEGADVIALQEVERFWPRSDMADQPKQLAKILPGYWWVFGPNIDLHSSETFPGEGADRRRQFGNMLLAKTPILASRNIALPRCAHLPFTMQRGAVEGIIRGANMTIRVYSTHLCYLSAQTRMEQLDAIVDAHAQAPHEGGSWSGAHPDQAVGWVVGDEPTMPAEAIAFGDMNFLPDSVEYRTHLDPAREAASGLLDAWRALGLPEESGITKPGHGRIDYALVSPGLVDRLDLAWVDSDAPGSDHQPLWLQVAM